MEEYLLAEQVRLSLCANKGIRNIEALYRIQVYLLLKAVIS